MMAEFIMDIGNSRIKLCALYGRTGHSAAAFPHNRAEKAVQWLSIRKAASVAVGSVNRPVERKMARLLSGRGIKVISADRRNLHGLSVRYDEKKLGLDRLANAVAARLLYGEERIIILDSGTALTVDLLEGRVFQGGFIMPGFETLLDSLNRRTDLLPRVKKRDPKVRLARTTADAIASGCLLQFSGGIRSAVEFLAGPGGKKPLLLATGGGPLPVEKLGFKVLRNPLLTFLGISLLTKK